MANRRTVFVSVSERSAELHASRLVAATRRLDPDIEFRGFGGDGLAEVGCRIDRESVSRASVGLGFLQHAKHHFGLVRRFDEILRRDRPDAVVLIDSPGFNFLLARLARWRGCPVVYYICPQIWAWAPWRLRKVLRYTDLLLPILPFETELYRAGSVPVVPVGHPLADSLHEVDAHGGRRLRDELGVGDDVRLVGLLPGSREQEVRSLMPIFRELLDDLQLDPDRYRVVISCFREAFRETIDQAMNGCSLKVDVPAADARTITQASDFVLLASGTASLEVAYFETPMAVFYYGAAWLRMVRPGFAATSYFALPNILGAKFNDGKAIVPERLCRGDEAAELAELVRPLLEDPQARATQVDFLRRVKEDVLLPGASERAAEALLDFLSRVKSEKVAE